MSGKKPRGRPKKESSIQLIPVTFLITQEVKTAREKAAKRAGKGINEWSSEILLKAAHEVLTGKQEIAKPEDVQDKVFQMIEEKLSNKFDDLIKELTKPTIQRLYEKYVKK
jgi:hypothetical protein